MSVLFTEAFDVWYANSSSFYRLYCGGFWLSVGVCLLERNVLGSGCPVGLCEGDPFFARNSGVEYMFSSVDKGVDNR